MRDPRFAAGADQNQEASKACTRCARGTVPQRGTPKGGTENK